MNPNDKDYDLSLDLDLDEDPQYRKDPFKEIPIKDFSYTDPSKIPKKKVFKIRKYVYLLVGVIVLIGIGFLIFHSSTNTSKVSKRSKVATAKVNQTNNKSVTPVGSNTSYNSTNFNLTMNYPNSWVISDTPTMLQLNSPITSIVDENNHMVQGKIIISVSPQGKFPVNLGSQPATAVLNSQLISYSTPTPAQDAQTYLSFLQYSSTNTVGGLDGVYVTGNYGYLKGQNIPQTNLANISPLVIITFQKCSDQKCSNLSNLTISAKDWSNIKFSTPIINIIKSFQFS